MQIEMWRSFAKNQRRCYLKLYKKRMGMGNMNMTIGNGDSDGDGDGDAVPNGDDYSDYYHGLYESWRVVPRILRHSLAQHWFCVGYCEQ